MYGYYSAEAAVQCGSIIYATPDGRGEMEVTCIDKSPTKPESYLWDDTVALGPIGRYLRSGKPSVQRERK